MGVPLNHPFLDRLSMKKPSDARLGYLYGKAQMYPSGATCIPASPASFLGAMACSLATSCKELHVFWEEA
jgi:hypothetical protein